MKRNLLRFSGFVLMIILTGCTFDYSETGLHINREKDGAELLLAKRSLRYLAENKRDSLKKMLNPSILKRTAPDQMEWLFKNGQKVLKDYIYPDDSLITVSNFTKKSVFGTDIVKEFNFPFRSKIFPDSARYFKIAIENRQIYKLLLFTGRQ